MDDAYRDKIVQAVTSAIFEAAKVGGSGPPVVRTGETCDALIIALATIACMSSEGTGSPTKTRRTSELFAKRFESTVKGLKATGALPRVIEVTDVAGVHPSSTSAH